MGLQADRPRPPGGRFQPGRAHAGEALLAAKHGEHVENAGRGSSAGQRGAQRLRDLAELDAASLGKIAHDRFGCCRVSIRPWRPASAAKRRASPRRLAQDGFAPFRRSRAGVAAKRKRAPSMSSTSVLARSFRPGIAASSLRAHSCVEFYGDLRAARQIGQGRFEHCHELEIGASRACNAR